ncbi:hypothetical protein MTO96_007211 [Rhipicephalus appendiculatus]
MKLLAAFVAVILAVTVCSDLSDAKVEMISEYRPYLRFARILALIESEEYALHVTAITRVVRKGKLVTIQFKARETRCKTGAIPPNPRKCRPLKRAIHDCTGRVKFLGGGFRRPKYLDRTVCIKIEKNPPKTDK